MNIDELRDKEYAFCKAEEDAFYENQSDANRIAALCKRDEFNRMMLRQQQAEIEELKAKMSPNSYDDVKNVANQLLQADNEPVAWMSTSGNNFISKKAPNYMRIGINDWIPLYTHTDEEYKPLTQADAPYQKVAPKEVVDEIDKALELKTLTQEKDTREMTPQEIIDLALEIGLGDAGDHLVPIRNGRSKYDGLLLIDEYCIGDYVIKFAEALGIEVIK